MRARVTMLAMVACGLAALGTAAAQMVGHTLRPERRDATEERIRRLKVPAGFAVDVFARDLGRARILAVADDGTVYVSRPDPGDVLALRDRDGEPARRVAVARGGPAGRGPARPAHDRRGARRPALHLRRQLVQRLRRDES
jgi:hypothetical protein